MVVPSRHCGGAGGDTRPSSRIGVGSILIGLHLRLTALSVINCLHRIGGFTPGVGLLPTSVVIVIGELAIAVFDTAHTTTA